MIHGSEAPAPSRGPGAGLGTLLGQAGGQDWSQGPGLTTGCSFPSPSQYLAQVVFGGGAGEGTCWTPFQVTDCSSECWGVQREGYLEVGGARPVEGDLHSGQALATHLPPAAALTAGLLPSHPASSRPLTPSGWPSLGTRTS